MAHIQYEYLHKIQCCDVTFWNTLLMQNVHLVFLDKREKYHLAETCYRTKMKQSFLDSSVNSKSETLGKAWTESIQAVKNNCTNK